MNTSLLSRLLGLWMLLTVLSLAVSRRATLEIFNALFTEPGLMFVAGAFMMLVGLAIVLTHNRWREGALAAAVTLLGWAVLASGVALASLPPALIIEAFAAAHFSQLLTAYLGVVLVAGACFTYAGFAARKS